MRPLLGALILEGDVRELRRACDRSSGKVPTGMIPLFAHADETFLFMVSGFFVS